MQLTALSSWILVLHSWIYFCFLISGSLAPTTVVAPSPNTPTQPTAEVLASTSWHGPISSFVGWSSHQPTSSLPSPKTSTPFPSYLSDNIPSAVENNNEPFLAKILEPRCSQHARYPLLKLNDYVCNTVRNSLLLTVSSVSSPTSGICSYPISYYVSSENSHHAIRIF